MKGSVGGSALFEPAVPVELAVALGVEVDDEPVVAPATLPVDDVDAGAVFVGAAGVDVALDGLVPVDGADELGLGAEECEVGVEACEVDVVPLSGSMYC